MFRCNKKGLQQADWVISMGIFLIYLVVFFIVVKPLLLPPDKADSLLTSVQDRLEDNVSITVDRMPVFLRQDLDNEYEPIIVDISYDWQESDITTSQGYSILDNSKVLFFANTSETEEYYIAHSGETRREDSTLTLIADSGDAQVDDFKVEFSGSIPSRYTYKGKFKIEDVDVYIDGEVFDGEASFDDEESIAVYHSEADVNHTTYVFAKNKRTYSFLTPADYRVHNFSLNFELYNYTEYYVDYSRFGDISHVFDECREFETDFIDISDGTDGVAFIFDEEYRVTLCNNETHLWLEVDGEINTTDEASYYIFMHRGDHTDLGDYPLDQAVGFKQEITSTSYAAISELAAMNYIELKGDWGIPAEHDFQIMLTSLNYNATIGPTPPLVDVYATTLRLFNYDGLDFEEAEVVVIIWGAS